VETDRHWRIVKGVALFILLALFLHLVVVMVAPDLSKPIRKTSIPAILLGTDHLYREDGQRGGKGIDTLESPLVQKIREEVVFKRLTEMALNEECRPQPPLPRVSIFPAGKLEEHEEMKILQGARFYHELEKIVHGEKQEETLFVVPKPKTSDVKGGNVPLPEDLEAQRIIANLRETAREERETGEPTETVALDIRGPAASRRVSSIPPSLTFKHSVDGACLLKFWVLPDGTLGKVIPLVKGNTPAIVTAIDQLKRYRFNPLPADVPQVEVWGIIPAQSVLR